MDDQPHASEGDLRRVADWIIEGFRVGELAVPEEVTQHIERCDMCATCVSILVVQLKVQGVEVQRQRWMERKRGEG